MSLEFISAHKTQLPGMGLRGVKNCIAIASGKGGVGKSTLTVNLAVALKQHGARVGILDADIYGPSIPIMLGATSPVQVNEKERYIPIKAHGITAMSIGYLTAENNALIWRGPMLAKALLQLINITEWDALDYLLIDLPPGTGDIQLSLVQKIPLAGAIVITTPQQVATRDAQKAIKMFEKTGIHLLGVVENMAIHTCTACGNQEHIFGQGGAEKMCALSHCKLLGQLPLDKSIQEHSDMGLPITTNKDSDISNNFMRIAETIMLDLSQRPLNSELR